MAVSNTIILRPRFKISITANHKTLLTAFETTNAVKTGFVVSRVDAHLFIRLPIQKQHFWSPQLHLEIIEEGEEKATVNGLFGPKPSVWTMFMFFHFVIAIFFIAFGIWTYTNYKLNTSFGLSLFFTLFMVVLWIVFYFIGRLGKAKGRPEMQLLYNFMNQTLKNYR